MSVVLRRTVWDDIDWRFDNLSGSHLQSQVICVTSVDTIRTPVVNVIGQLIRDVIGRLSVEPRSNWLGRLNSDWCVIYWNYFRTANVGRLELRIGHFRKYRNTLCSPLLHFCISIVFVFSWDRCKSQEKLETMLMQNLGEQTKSIMVFSEVACRAATEFTYVLTFVNVKIA